MSSESISTRERILKSAWSLLELGGGNAVRMSDIAKAAKVSRQAVYLHFPNRAELLIATTRYLDEVHDIDGKLQASRNASSGIERLERWIDAWGGHIPTVYGVAKALMAMQEFDVEAKIAWKDRMQAVRDGCEAAVVALEKDGVLTESLNKTDATDMLWTLLSARNWEHLRIDCKWSQKKYLAHIQRTAKLVLTN